MINLHSIDDFIISCESYKIYECDYAAATEGIFSTIGKTAVAIAQWIKHAVIDLLRKISGKKYVWLPEAYHTIIYEYRDIEYLIDTDQSKFAAELESAEKKFFDNIGNQKGKGISFPIKDLQSLLKKIKSNNQLKQASVDVLKPIQTFIQIISDAIYKFHGKTKETQEKYQRKNPETNDSTSAYSDEVEEENVEEKEKSYFSVREQKVRTGKEYIWGARHYISEKGNEEPEWYSWFDELDDAKDYGSYRKIYDDILANLGIKGSYTIRDIHIQRVKDFDGDVYYDGYAIFLSDKAPFKVTSSDVLIHSTDVKGLTELKPVFKSWDVHGNYPTFYSDERVYFYANKSLHDTAGASLDVKDGATYEYRPSSRDKVYIDPEYMSGNAVYIASSNPIPVIEIKKDER